MIKITVLKRWPGYEAHITGNKRVWEGGLTEVEAIGKLMIQLDANARAKTGISAGLAWLARSTRCRIERKVKG